MQTYITREQDYALRIVTYLAELKKEQHISIKDLSKELFISRSFAARIIHKLKHGGIIKTIEGNQGGVLLRKGADDISLLDVLNIIGFKTIFNACNSRDYNCELSKRCRFHNFFVEEENSLKNKLHKKKISEFVFGTKINVNQKEEN
ncbi:MAG: Rrf2 family transcriptional regulator [Ignavibacteria bacterium]|jgi:Rrf2 family protein